jgi:PEP-CTERM motif
MKRLPNVVRVLAVAGVLSLIALPSHAALLNLTLQGNPDMFVNYLDITYTESSDNFHVDGFSDTYTDPSNTQISTGFGAYTLDATITGAGVLTSGSFTIDGDVGGGPTTLLTGSLNTGAEGVAFGASSAGDGLFEFLYTVSGGSLAGDFGGIGASGGIIMSPVGGGFTDAWNVDFNNGGVGSGYADHAPLVPEPSSFLLLLFGAALCVATHRSRSRTHMSKLA